jgi:hypothetical protein
MRRPPSVTGDEKQGCIIHMAYEHKMYHFFHWLPLASTGFHWFPLASTGFHWLPLASTGFHWLPFALSFMHLKNGRKKTTLETAPYTLCTVLCCYRPKIGMCGWYLRTFTSNLHNLVIFLGSMTFARIIFAQRHLPIVTFAKRHLPRGRLP